jgi:hypothetical protein
MTEWSNVHLLFCEGPHDAAFLNRLLKNHLGFKKIELKLSELPYPIRNVLQQSFKTRAAEDLRLDLAKKFFLPDFLVERGSTVAMVFNYGGSNRQVNMTSFLKNIFDLLGAPAFAGKAPAECPKYAYALFADADVLGISGALALISKDLATIGGSAWLSSDWTAINHSTAVMQETAFGPTSAYIWKKSAEDNGTLEDIVLECLASNEGLQKTLQFLDERFNWNPPTDASPKQVCASAAKRLKAAFCVEGQHEKPGMSLGVVLDQTDLLRQEAIDNSPAVKGCLTFLTDWLI